MITDIQTVERTCLDEIGMEKVAKRAAQIISDTYPNHLWMIGWHPGANLVIKNMAISSQIGRVVHYAKCRDENDFERQVKMAGGALLELAHMKRGAWNGELADQLDGRHPMDYHEMLRKQG